MSTLKTQNIQPPSDSDGLTFRTNQSDRVTIGADGFVNILNGTVTGGITLNGSLNLIGGITASGGATFGGRLRITDSTASSSTSTGALVVSGGVGVGGDFNVGGNAYFSTGVTVAGGISVSGNATFRGTVFMGPSAAPFYGPTGNAPIYGIRAFVTFDGGGTAGANGYSGSWSGLNVGAYVTNSSWYNTSNGWNTQQQINLPYSHTGTTVTFTETNHRHLVNHVIRALDTSGRFTSGGYRVSAVTDNTFSIVVPNNQATTVTGTATLTRNTIRKNGNIHSVYNIATGSYAINFAIPMPDSLYAVVSTSMGLGHNQDNVEELMSVSDHIIPTTTSVVVKNASGSTPYNSPAIYLMIIG